LVLSYYLDLTLADAAATLGIPLGTMKSRLSRATDALRASVDATERLSAYPAERLA
jgi:DNA-directed RNA polymerase specialized sigma24 family protein